MIAGVRGDIFPEGWGVCSQCGRHAWFLTPEDPQQ
jgi:hypothetical protein